MTPPDVEAPLERHLAWLEAHGRESDGEPMDKAMLLDIADALRTQGRRSMERALMWMAMHPRRCVSTGFAVQYDPQYETDEVYVARALAALSE